jgi:hypothetical protein
MRRRGFVAGLMVAAALQPLATLAQQPAIPVIGHLGSVPLPLPGRADEVIE